MAQEFTYYYTDGRVEVKSGPLSGRGVVWIDGAYYPPTYPSALNVRVGDPGVRVIAVIRGLQAYHGEPEGVLQEWKPLLLREDIEAAVNFYEQPANREQIDHQIAQDAAVV